MCLDEVFLFSFSKSLFWINWALCIIKFCSIKSNGFSSSRVWMWVGVMKNWFFQTVVLEKALESPLDCKEIKPVNPKGNQPWIFIGKTDAEVEVPILWPFDAKSLIVGKDPDAGKDWGHEEKGATKDETVGRHHQLNGDEFEQTLGDSEGQGSLACYSPWGRKESDTTKQLNNNKPLGQGTHVVLW